MLLNGLLKLRGGPTRKVRLLQRAANSVTNVQGYPTANQQPRSMGAGKLLDPVKARYLPSATSYFVKPS